MNCGGFCPAPFSFGGDCIVSSIYDTLRSSLPGAIQGEHGTESDLMTEAIARMVAVAWESEDRRFCNEYPGTSWDRLRDWSKRLGVIDPESFRDSGSLQAYLEYGDRLDWERATELKIIDACRFALGNVHGNVPRAQFDYWLPWNITGDFSNAYLPNPNYWPATAPNPPDNPWTSPRALVHIFVRKLPTETSGDIELLIKQRLDPIFEWMFPFWASWRYTISDYTPSPLVNPIPVPETNWDAMDRVTGHTPSVVLVGSEAGSVSQGINLTKSHGLQSKTWLSGTGPVPTMVSVPWRTSGTAVSLNTSGAKRCAFLVDGFEFSNSSPLSSLDFTVVMYFRSIALNNNNKYFFSIGGELDAEDSISLMTPLATAFALRTVLGGVVSQGNIASATIGNTDTFLVGLTTRTNGANKEFQLIAYRNSDVVGSPSVNASVTRAASSVFGKPTRLSIGGRLTEDGTDSSTFNMNMNFSAAWKGLSLTSSDFLAFMQNIYRNKFL